jgi:rsbT co-antagonist protein RsbR
VLTGVRPEVARTLVEIGVHLGGLMTLRTLRDGLRACLAMRLSDRKSMRSFTKKRRTQVQEDAKQHSALVIGEDGSPEP